jgi:hypothetical protein
MAITPVQGKQIATASWAINAISSSYSATASYALNAGTTINTGSFVTTSSFNSFTSSYNTGSFTGSFTGSLLGTASWAISSSRAVSSSFATSTSTLIGFGAATVEQINEGEANNGTYSYVIKAQELEQSKHSTINIYNNLNFT